jgi:uncharacterized delta-60 repeat protein
VQLLGRVNPRRANSRCGPSSGLHLLIPVLCLISAIRPAGASAQSAPAITQQPQSQSLLAGSNAAFTVSATGQTPLRYQWSFNGTNLSNNSHIGGVTNATLVVSNIASSDAGNYRVVITNSHGSATSSNATLSVLLPPAITNQPVSVSAAPGGSASFTVGAAGSSPLSFQWYQLSDQNISLVPGGNASTLSLANLTGANAGAYYVVVSNAYGTVVSSVAFLSVNYLAADSLNPGLSPFQGSLDVAALAIQPDCEILMGGSFYAPGFPINIGRLNADGTLGSFLYSEVYYYNDTNCCASVYAITSHTNGAIVIGGAFSSVNGYIRPNLARFNQDGYLDLNYNPGANGPVSCLVLQPDGAIIVGGSFTNLAGQARTNIGRLQPDGTLDTGFNPGVDRPPNCLALQQDGKILVGGSFQTLAGQPCLGLGRLNANGSLDATFNPSPNGAPNTILVQPDGRIIVGGNFNTLAGVIRHYLGRLNSDGSIDTNFYPAVEAGFQVNSLALQTDGRIVVGGVLQQSVMCFPVSPLARLNPDGTADLTFNPCATMTNVQSLAIQKDGGIVVGGHLFSLAGQPRNGIGRLVNPYPAPAAESLTFDGSSVTWLRSGTGTEIWRASFEYSTDGLNWTYLGDANRISGGWQLSALSIPTTNSIVRARGFAAGGNWFIETVVGLPVLTSQPQSLTNYATSNVTFTVTGYGGTLLNYQWLKNGVPLSGGQSFSAGQTLSLTLTNVLGADAAGYSLVLSNASGSITSSIASLTIIDPWITAQPFSQTENAGQGATFTVSAVGTIPLIFQWLQNGTNLTDTGNLFGSQTAVFVLTNLTGTNAGSYQAIVTNMWGTATSSVVTLGVEDPYIYTRPVSQSARGGQTVTLSVGAAGTQPLAYHWRKGGSPLPDATNSTLIFPSVQGFDGGAYDVVVSDYFGSVTSSVANLTVTDPFIITNPTNQFLQVSQTVFLTVIAGGGSPLSYQWLRNGSPVQDATTTVLVFTNAQGTNAGYYSVIVSDAFASVTSSVAAVTVDAVIADSFNPFVPTTVQATAIQPDGKILLGMATGPNRTPLNLLRLWPDGSPDTSFVVGITNTVVNCLAVQPDGKIVVGGSGSNNQKPIYLWRLNADGSTDTNFFANLGTGPSGLVDSLALQPDGKILLAGGFTSISGQVHPYLGRVNSDGSLDTSFNASASGTVNCLGLQPDGAILVGGLFSSLNGQPRSRFGRFLNDGSLDTTFNANANGSVLCMVVQADGKIVIGGNFTTIAGLNRNYIARLNPDATIDANFNPNANSPIYSLIAQTDGRIVVGGLFTTLSGLSRNRVGRLNAGGSVDLMFNPGAGSLSDPVVYSLALQSDGAVLVGGRFGILDGASRTNIGRIINTEPAVQSLTFDASSVTWLRSGTSPEVWRTTFESSGNGLDWTYLGAGQRIADGWQLTGLNLSQVRNLRGRGFCTSGQFDGSVSVLQTLIGAPVMLSQPRSLTNNPATTAIFRGSGDGSPPLSYQWLKGGLPLQDGGNVFGSHTTTLTLSNVFGLDAGSYALRINNASGSITSSVAILVVRDPLITTQPTNQIANAGQNVSFTVASIGTAPLTYQWHKNGTNISALNAPTLLLTNVGRGDTASYSVLVSTPYGSALTSNATLTVNLAVPDSFNPGSGDYVRHLVPQTDGKILVAYGGTTNNAVSSTPLVRLNRDGSLDTAFNPNADSWLYTLILQPDGRMLAGGTFNYIAGQYQRGFARLNQDGSLDAGFRPVIENQFGIFQPGVASAVVQPDGKILAGGFFDSLAGSASNICRLNIDGSLDTNFLCNVNNGLRTMALQPDGRIIIGGYFTSVNGQPRSNIARLNSDGSLDPSFSSAADNQVWCLVVQPDAKILVAGQFNTLAGVAHLGLGRLTSDGSLDTNFTATANNQVETLALQADGKIIVGGFFSSLAGVSRKALGRLNPDGTPDAAFFPTLSGFPSNVFTPEIQGLALQPDGSLLLGGAFTAVDGQPRASLARLAPTDSAGQYLSSDGRSITWLRGGTAPEVWRTTFETSTNGTNWTMIGAGSRTSGGWRVSGLSLPANEMLRARGYTSGGYWTGSGWFVESLAQVLVPPSIIANDASFGLRSNQFGFIVSAVPGQAVVIEASTDFVHWLPVQTNLATSLASIVFSDSQTGLFRHRFYRARLYVGNLPPPAFGGSPGFQAGGFGFYLGGVAGQTVIVEASSDLQIWNAISTNLLTTAPIYFNDPATQSLPQRFYRLLLYQ